MPLLRHLIGAVLRRLRREQGRTLRDVAGAAGVSIPYLSEIERGRKEPSSEILESICRALGIHLADLLDELRHEVIRLRQLSITAPARVPVRSRPVGSARPPGPVASAQGRSARRRINRRRPVRR